MEQRPLRVFISYSHTDEQWLNRVKQHLIPVVRESGLDCWDDTHIQPGDDWKQEIQNALDTAQAAVLLISASFFASDFINENELPPLLTAAQAEGVRILPVILSASRFGRHPDLARFQAINSPDRPLTDMPWGEQEKVFNCLAQTIETLIPEPDSDRLHDSMRADDIVSVDPNEPLIPNLSSTIGSIHVHIDGGEDKELAERCARLIDPDWSRSEIAQITQFIEGPQRNNLKEVYAEHTPTKSGRECLQFFSTTVLHESGLDPSGCELAEIEDKVRLVLGRISVEPREPGGIVVEAERVIGLIDANGEARWAETVSLPSAFGPNFTFRKKNAFSDRTLYEIHFALDIPRKSEAELPISLSDLVKASAQADIWVGGWFIFWKPNKWAYRSNMFLNHLDQDRIHLDWQRLNEQLKKINGIDPTELSVRVIVEESLGVWKVPFEKVDRDSLTVPELAAWEARLPPSTIFWAVTGNFLGDQHKSVRNAMLRNFAVDTRYVYFLQSFADLTRWQRFRQELEKEHRGSATKMDAFVIEFEKPEIWSEKLDCFIAQSGSESEGYKLARDPYNNNIIKGKPVASDEINNIKALLQPLMKERAIVSTLHLAEETFLDGCVLWLDYGYFDMIKHGKPNESDLAQFLDEYDSEISADISKCGGEVIGSSEMGFVIILARNVYEKESEIVGRTFRLARAMLDLLETKFRSMDVDSTSHRLILGYGTMRRFVRSSGRAVTGDFFRECRRKAASLGPGRAVVFPRIYDILAQAESPWLGLLSPIEDDGFDINWSKIQNHKL